MRAILLAIGLIAGLLAVPSATAWDPTEDDKCVWIMNGPIFFNRVCVDLAAAPECAIYQESWNWEGGYRKTCVGV